MLPDEINGAGENDAAKYSDAYDRYWFLIPMVGYRIGLTLWYGLGQYL